MTNEDYIRKKREEKFDILWNLKVQNLPPLSMDRKVSEVVEYKDTVYYFNKQENRFGEVVLVCRTGCCTERGVSTEHKMVYSKNDLKEIFGDFAAFKKETKQVINDLKTKKRSLSNYDYSTKREIERSIWLHQLQEEYVSVFFAYLKWGVKKETAYGQFSIDEIKEWVNKSIREKRYSSRYYEFLDYKLSKIMKYKNVSINDILLDKKDAGFIGFCVRCKFNTLYPLLYIPYYSKGLLEKFSFDTIDRVILEIKRFIDNHILLDEYITSIDIEELDDEF